MKTILDHLANTMVFIFGMFHTVMTLLYQRPFDLDALMYVGAGLAFIFLAFINFARSRTTEKLVMFISMICNIIILIYIILIALEFADPRAFVVTFSLILLVVLSAIDVKLSMNN